MKVWPLKQWPLQGFRDAGYRGVAMDGDGSFSSWLVASVSASLPFSSAHSLLRKVEVCYGPVH